MNVQEQNKYLSHLAPAIAAITLQAAWYVAGICIVTKPILNKLF